MTGNGTHDRCRDRTDGRELLATSSRAAAERERGQTTQDFAVGIGIFLLAIAFVFMFLPSVVTPFDSSVGGAETAQADRIADRIVSNSSTDRPNGINSTDFQQYTNTNLADELGLRADGSHEDDIVYDNVNVTVVEVGNDKPVEIGGVALAGGEHHSDQPAATAARIVTVTDMNCEPACRLVVKVW